MKVTNLLWIIFTVGAIGLTFIALEKSEPKIIEKECKDEIIKKKFWCENHNRNEVTWIIKGHKYYVKETPHGQYEIVGLYARFK